MANSFYRDGSFKYGNHKCEHNGIKFDSELERQRYIVLKKAEDDGKISDLKTQVSFKLIGYQKGKIRNEYACSYIADFTYIQNGELIVEDVKGFRPKEYIIKRKLMKLFHGIEVVEVDKKTVVKMPEISGIDQPTNVDHTEHLMEAYDK